MQLRRPKPKTVYVTMTDASTRKSAATTVYGTSAEHLMREFKRLVLAKESQRATESAAEQQEPQPASSQIA